jgi:hypothetical protein
MLMRAERDATAAMYAGLYAGKVEKAEDLGRIQVSVPAIFDQTTPEFFVWARPCFPYGHFFVPEVGDHVWIAFENGDPAAPVWLGVWYPKGGVPPEADVSPPVKRVIRSAKGHLVILDDDAGKETIMVKHSGGKAKIVLSKDDLTLSFGNNSIAFSDNAIEISFGSSKVTLNNQGVTVKGTRIDLNP